MNESKKEPSKQPESLSILQTIGSVLAAALGVQKRANLERVSPMARRAGSSLPASFLPCSLC